MFNKVYSLNHSCKASDLPTSAKVYRFFVTTKYFMLKFLKKQHRFSQTSVERLLTFKNLIISHEKLFYIPMQIYTLLRFDANCFS